MAELSKISPLLDQMTIGVCMAEHNGVACYELTHTVTQQRFICKHISVPASEDKAQALILAGAYPDTASANEYFKHEVDDIQAEVEAQKALADCRNFNPYLQLQAVPKESGLGYDVYLVAERAVSLKEYLSENAMTNLRAVNLGIDLAAALAELREAGYVFRDIKPENVFLSEQGFFMLGDLGLAPTLDMCYSSLPEEFFSEYTAPELHDMLAGLNDTIDIYALGILLYRIYNNGHAPFEDERNSAKEAEACRLAGKNLPAPMYADYELAEIILKACAFKPEDRYTSPIALGQALTQYMQRNEVSDTLIVPPIISEPEPIELTQEPEQPEPVRFTDAASLDDAFKAHFTPNAAAVQEVIVAAREDERREAAKLKTQVPEDLDALLAASDAALSGKPLPTSEYSEPAAQQTDEQPPEQTQIQSVAQEEEQTSHDEIADLPEAKPEPSVEPEEPEEPEESVIRMELPNTPDEPDKQIEPPDEPEETQTQTMPGLRMVEITEAAEPEAEEPEMPEQPRKKKKAGWIIAAILVLLLGAAAYIYYGTDFGRGLYHFFIRVDSVELVSADCTSLTVKVTAGTENAPIAVSCKNPYGSSAGTLKPEDGTVRFEGLTPGTEYTILAVPDGTHKLLGSTSCTATTLPATEVVAFHVSNATAQGVAELSLAIKAGDKDPDAWTAVYGYEEGNETSISFTGTKTTITGLIPEKAYVFRLEASDGLALTGATQTSFTPLKEITAQNLQMDSFAGGTLTLSWNCSSDMPDSWTVVCTDNESEQSTELQTQNTTATFEGLTVGKGYLITVSTPGLWKSLELEIPSNLIEITAMTAQQQEDGILISWEAATAPEGGWLLVSKLGEADYLQNTVTVEETSYLLTVPVSEAAYSFSLQAADGRGLVGITQTQCATKQAEEIDFANLVPVRLRVATYLAPEGDDWDYDDLDGEVTSFRTDEKLAFVLSASRTPTRKDGSVTFTYVLRRADDSIADYNAELYEWNKAWTDRKHITQLLRTPQEPGEYTLEVYISGAYAASMSFTVTQAPAE